VWLEGHMMIEQCDALRCRMPEIRGLVSGRRGEHGISNVLDGSNAFLSTVSDRDFEHMRKMVEMIDRPKIP